MKKGICKNHKQQPSIIPLPRWYKTSIQNIIDSLFVNNGLPWWNFKWNISWKTWAYVCYVLYIFIEDCLSLLLQYLQCKKVVQFLGHSVVLFFSIKRNVLLLYLHIQCAPPNNKFDIPNHLFLNVMKWIATSCLFCGTVDK